MEEDAGPVRKLVFPAQFENLDKVREFVGQAAHDSGLIGNDIYQVQLAVDEACTNIIEHAYGGESRKRIDCTCRIETEKLTVVLEDCGRPFSPAEIPAPDLDADIEHRPAGGLGLYLIRQLMDEVEYTFEKSPRNGTHHNTVRMVKQKGRRH